MIGLKNLYKHISLGIILGSTVLFGNYFLDTDSAKAADENYLLIGKNYFEDPNITKGELDKKVGPIGSPRDPGDVDLTFNEIYMKYNFGPEMTNISSNRYNYNPYNYLAGSGAYVLKQYDKDANAIKDESGVQLLYEPTPVDKILQSNNNAGNLGASNIPAVPDSFMPKNGQVVIKPLFFSYLYVGDGIAGENNNYQYTKDFLVPDSMGYNETNKVSDYMLNETNNFVIPMRYNEVRNDITLLMRSKTEINTNTPQILLEAKNEDGSDVQGSKENKADYLETTVSFHLLPFSFNHLGGIFQQNKYKTTAKNVNGKVSNIADYNKTLNDGFAEVRKSSTAGIVFGSGGGTSMKGFYRDGEKSFTATTAERYASAENTKKVRYYVWQKETEFMTGTTVDSLKTWGQAALDDKVEGISDVLSPEITHFKIKMFRPTITSETEGVLEYDLINSNFEELLGLPSIKVEDNGVETKADAKGDSQKIKVDLENIRVRIREEGGEWSKPLKISEVKAKLVDYEGKTADILYTYSATDANKENILLLPSEIKDDTGAYAIPLQKKIKIEERQKSDITVKYFVEGTDELLFEKTTTGKEQTSFSHTAPNKYTKGGVSYKLVTTPAKVDATYTLEDQSFNFYYEEIPVGTITVRYVDKDGVILKTLDEVTGEVGSAYKTTAPKTFKLNGKNYKKVESPSNANGKYELGNTNIDYVYELVETVKPKQGTVTVRYVDEDGVLLFEDDLLTDEVGKAYKTSAPNSYKKGGKVYKKVKTPANSKGKYVEGNINVDYVYEEVITVEPGEGSVTVRYVDEDGILLFKDDLMTDEIGKAYKTSAQSRYEKDGKVYKLVKTPANSKGKYIDGNINVDYVYEEVADDTTGGGGGGSTGGGGGSNSGTLGGNTDSNGTDYTPTKSTLLSSILPKTGVDSGLQLVLSIVGFILFMIFSLKVIRQRKTNLLR